MLALLVEVIYLATFYGLYFNHQFFLHITLYNFSIIFIEHFPPLPGFEAGTSPVPSQYATN